MKNLSTLIICLILASCVFTKNTPSNSNKELKISLEREYLQKYNSDSLQKFCKYPDTTNCIKISMYDSTYFAFIKNKHHKYNPNKPYSPNEEIIAHNKNFNSFWFREELLNYIFYSVRDSVKDGKYLVYKNGDKNYKYNSTDTLVALMNFKDGYLDGTNYIFRPNNKIHWIYIYQNSYLKQIINFNHLGQIYSNRYINQQGKDSTTWFGNKGYSNRMDVYSNYSIEHAQYAGYYSYYFKPNKQLNKDNKNFPVIIKEIKDYYLWNKDEGYDAFYGDKIIKNYTKKETDSTSYVKTHEIFNKYGEKTYYNSTIIKKSEMIEGKYDSTTYFYDIHPYDDNISSDSIFKMFNKIKGFYNLSSLRLRFYGSSEYYDCKFSQSDSSIIYGFKLLPNLQKFKYLESVRIDNPYLKKIPSFIYKSASINWLYLTVNDLDVITKKISKCKNLETLILDGKTTDINRIISEVSKLQNLKILYLFLKECDTVPSNLYKLASLEELTLQFPTDYVYPWSKTQFKLDSTYLKGLNNLKYLVVGYSNYERLQNFIEKNMPNCYLGEIGSGCLAKGTQILQTNNKNISIENLKIGDILLAYNEQTKSIDTTIVTKTFIHPQHFDNCLNIIAEFNGKLIAVQTTDNHPFYTQEKQWITAGELTLDMHLLIFDETSNSNKFVKITSITPIKEGLPTVYNIETSKHNYFANGILVHNK